MGFFNSNGLPQEMLDNLVNKVYRINVMCEQYKIPAGYGIYYDPNQMKLAFAICPNSRQVQLYSLDGCAVLAQGDPMLVNAVIENTKTVLEYTLGMLGTWNT